jgi:hypothetical protein
MPRLPPGRRASDDRDDRRPVRGSRYECETGRRHGRGDEYDNEEAQQRHPFCTSCTPLVVN